MSNSFGVVLEDMCHLCAGLLQVFDGLVQSAACPLSEFTSLLGMGRRQAMERCAVSIFYCHSESSESLLMSVAKFCQILPFCQNHDHVGPRNVVQMESSCCLGHTSTGSCKSAWRCWEHLGSISLWSVLLTWFSALLAIADMAWKNARNALPGRCLLPLPMRTACTGGAD